MISIKNVKKHLKSLRDRYIITNPYNIKDFKNKKLYIIKSLEYLKTKVSKPYKFYIIAILSYLSKFIIIPMLKYLDKLTDNYEDNKDLVNDLNKLHNKYKDLRVDIISNYNKISSGDSYYTSNGPGHSRYIQGIKDGSVLFHELGHSILHSNKYLDYILNKSRIVYNTGSITPGDNIFKISIFVSITGIIYEVNKEVISYINSGKFKMISITRLILDGFGSLALLDELGASTISMYYMIKNKHNISKSFIKLAGCFSTYLLGFLLGYSIRASLYYGYLSYYIDYYSKNPVQLIHR